MLLPGICMVTVGFLLAIPDSACSSISSNCHQKTVTVSTLRALRERELTLASAASSSPFGPGDSRLPLQVHSEAPGSVSVSDDLHNTEPPYFVLEMSGNNEDLSLVYWTQQWLANGTLFFHVSLHNMERISHSTTTSIWEPSQGIDENLHVFHVSVMGGLIAILLLLVIFSVALYAQRRWYKRRRIPQKSASTEATHEIHYIPSVLLGRPTRDRRSSILQSHNSVLRMSIRETPILDDYDCEDEETLHCIKLGDQISKSKSHICQEWKKEQRHLGHRGSLKSPLSRTASTLIGVSACVLVVVCGSQLPCPLTVKVTLHVPEHFIADGSNFVISEGSYLDVSDWLNPAQIFLFYKVNASSPWIKDLCGQRTIDACEQICDSETDLRSAPQTPQCCYSVMELDPQISSPANGNVWQREEGVSSNYSISQAT
ncbi:Hypothetical predicted protein [Pelobates cultripes]|uniref:Astrotactin-1/2 N-terminal domain-containing protein n=1 Tax=Pelobates cultripes TaxID=61616 RepID=A0AAD1T1Q1_PELCU|nr:Hypothetical predicted protein [Pelobates cultripes]